MANAKVTLNGVTLIDLTSDTVASDNLLNGYIAHRSDGEIITGTYVPASVSLIPGNADPTESSQYITPPSGYDGFEYFEVGAIPSQYIVTTDATATASDILYNKTAYVNGSKITGTFELARVNDTTLILNNTNSSVNGTTLII